MNIVFSDEIFPEKVVKSIFLAGPSPRSATAFWRKNDWRKDAIKFLEANGYDGTVYIPIPKNKFFDQDSNDSSWSYDNQIEWECQARARADALVFWIPRQKEMPGLTTNIEFGEDLHKPNIFYGRPDEAESCRYLDKRVLDNGKLVHSNMESLFTEVIDYLDEGSLRKEGETEVPLCIWKSPSFKSWYQNLRENGNKLLSFDLKETISVGTQREFLFFFSAKVNIWVEKEQRYKANECIFSRTNISSVVSYYVDPETKERTIALAKEFRSPVSNKEGFVYELPGGSAFDDQSYVKNAQSEYWEEMGVDVDQSRFKLVSERQLAATFGTHTSHLYKLELNKEEFEQLQARSLVEHEMGLHNDELIYVVLVKEKDLYDLPVDYTTLGMIFEGLNR